MCIHLDTKVQKEIVFLLFIHLFSAAVISSPTTYPAPCLLTIET